MKSAEFNLLAGIAYTPSSGPCNPSSLKPGEHSSLTYKEASKVLNRKGFRYKDEATLIAMVTAKHVLASAPSLTEEEKMRCAVIVSSNLGNLNTVVETAQLIDSEDVNATSAMALPNASSNVTSASIAIVFQLRGPNLMLCNGRQSGMDAFQLAQDLMTAGRAERVLIIGVEVDNSCVRSLFENIRDRFHGGAGYLLERADLEPKRDKSNILARIRTEDTAEYAVSEKEVHFFSGDASGASGVLQLLLASEHANNNEPRSLKHNENCWRVVK